MNLVRHIEEFTCGEMSEALEDLSAVTSNEELKQSVAVARELSNQIKASEVASLKTETGEEAEKISYAELAQELQSALSVLQECILSTTKDLQPALSVETLQKMSKAVIHLQDDLANVVCGPSDVIYLPGK